MNIAMTMPMLGDWQTMTPQAKMEAVFSLASEGLSGKRIAERFNVTRNTIIGFAKRNDIKLTGNANRARREPNDRPSVDRTSEAYHLRRRLERAKAAEKRQAAKTTRVAELRLAKKTAQEAPGRASPPELAPEPQKVDRSAAWLALPESRSVPLHEVGASECSWPLWNLDGEPKLFCGAQVDAGTHYCREHLRLAYPAGMPPKMGERGSV